MDGVRESSGSVEDGPFHFNLHHTERRKQRSNKYTSNQHTNTHNATQERHERTIPRESRNRNSSVSPHKIHGYHSTATLDPPRTRCTHSDLLLGLVLTSVHSHVRPARNNAYCCRLAGCRLGAVRSTAAATCSPVIALAFSSARIATRPASRHNDLRSPPE